MQSNDQISIYDYTDYRVFLKSYILKKQRAGRYNASQFARQIGLKDTSSITKILNGQRNPGEGINQRIIKKFNFNSEQESHYRNLVGINKEKNLFKRSEMIEQLKKKSKKASFYTLDLAQFELISNWHSYALRESIRLKDFKLDTTWLKKKFSLNTTSDYINKIFQNLEELKLIKITDDNQVQILKGRYSPPLDYPSDAIKSFHDGAIQRGVKSLYDTPVNKRHICSSTIAIKREKVAEAKKLIDEFQDRLSSLVESDQADEVYMFNMQFFPLTKESER